MTSAQAGHVPQLTTSKRSVVHDCLCVVFLRAGF